MPKALFVSLVDDRAEDTGIVYEPVDGHVLQGIGDRLNLRRLGNLHPMHICRAPGSVGEGVKFSGRVGVAAAGVNGHALGLVLADEFEPKAAVGASY